MIEAFIKISGSIFVAGLGLCLFVGALMVLLVLLQTLKERYIN